MIRADPRVSVGAGRSRTGTVLTNSPTIRSMPATAAGRPDTVMPKTTSDRPVSWASSRPQAPWSSVLTVTPRSAARRDSSMASAAGSGTSSRVCPASSGTVVAERASGTSRVGSSTPSSSSAQASSAACLSWLAVHSRNRRKLRGRGSVSASSE